MKFTALAILTSLSTLVFIHAINDSIKLSTSHVKEGEEFYASADFSDPHIFHNEQKEMQDSVKYEGSETVCDPIMKEKFYFIAKKTGSPTIVCRDGTMIHHHFGIIIKALDK